MSEFTVEANPGGLSEHYLRALRRCRFTRLGLGVQTLNDDELSVLGRIDTVDQSPSW